jgi:pilus assembly protein FimV
MGEAWDKAAALGRQLDPSNKLYNGAGGTVAAAGPAKLDLVAAATNGPDTVRKGAGVGVKAAAGGAHLDFNLDQYMPTLPAAQDPDATVIAPTEPAKREPVAPVASLAAAAKAPVETVANRPPFDFDLKLDDILGVPGVDAPQPKIRDAALATMDLMPTPAKAAAAAAGSSAAGAKPTVLDLDRIDLDFGAGAVTFGDQAPALDGQWQDSATKLDLAKAYQEMGDFEGAREILQEVLHEGDDQQKKDAQALIAKLAS